MEKKLSKEEFIELYKRHQIHKKMSKNREYRKYKAYQGYNYRKIINSYFSSKYNDKRKLLCG